MAYTNEDQIGEITEVTGTATITHTDGSEEIVTLGSPIYQGDIVETEGLGAVNIGFIDDSSFAISQDAKISIDEFVFDPENETGDQDFSVMHGVFMYTSGLIGRENPDSVEIDTPVGSIGIRGTIIGGNIDETGESQITVVEGAIVVRNDAGEQLLTNQFDTVKLFDRSTSPSEVKTLNVQEVANDYGSIKNVNADLFSSFEDQMKQEGPSNNLDAEQSSEEIDDAAKEESNTDELPAEEQTAHENLSPVLKSVEAHKELNARDHKHDGKNDGHKTRSHNEGVENQQQEDHISTFTATPTIRLLAGDGSILEGSDGSSTPIFIGQVALDGVANTTGTVYSLTTNPGNNFSIDENTGEVSFIGSHARDFETGHDYHIQITATGPQGQHASRLVTIELENLEEIDTAFEDTYSVTGNIDGVIDTHELGSYATEITIDGQSAGENHNISDFTILGAQATFFELAEIDGEIILQLKSDVQINDYSSTYKFEVSSVEDSTPYSKTSALNLQIQLNDNGEIIPVKLAVAEVHNVIGVTEDNISIHDIVIGDNDDNIMLINDASFKFISGGEGHDILKLDGTDGSAMQEYFALTSTASNLSNNSSDLKSIEEIRFVDDMDVLKLNIQDLKDLLRTSENGELIIANGGDSSTGTSGSGHNGLIIYDGSGSPINSLSAGSDTIQDYGFTQSANTVTHDGETFNEYVHADLGSLLIETNIDVSGTNGL